MAKLQPKAIPESAWVQLSPDVDFAVRADKNEPVNIRLGAGQGVYLSIAPSPTGRFIFGVDFESGEHTLLARMPEGQPIAVGRTSECLVKILHPIVSRRHIEMRLHGGVAVVRDLGSTNKSFLAPDTPHFDIAKYLESYDLNGSEDRTLDQIHEQFGPTLDDFLRSYSQDKEDQK